MHPPHIRRELRYATEIFGAVPVFGALAGEDGQSSDEEMPPLLGEKSESDGYSSDGEVLPLIKESVSIDNMVGATASGATASGATANAVLALFDQLVRGLPEDKLRALVADALKDADAAGVEDVFVLAFQTRWCRGGKGERSLALVMLKVLYEIMPSAVLALVELLPRFGSWKDPLALLVECGEHYRFAPLHERVWVLFAVQLETDRAELNAAAAEGRAAKVSMCGKYAPSEGGAFARKLKADKAICALLFPAATSASRSYRKLLSGLRSALNVPETSMCGKRWSSIEFSAVPSLCMDRNKRSFLNETKKGEPLHPGDADREECRERLLKAVVAKGVAALNGKQLYPHELVAQVISRKNQGDVSSGIAAVLNAQWDAIRNGLLDMVAERKAMLQEGARPLDDADALAAAASLCPGVTALRIAADVASDAAVTVAATRPVGLSRVVAMSDVSGSMSGTPMDVSIALGILVSEVSHPAFRDKVLTFESSPKWHDLSDENNFVGKAKSLSEAPWGGSTNFAAAMSLIADMVRSEQLEAHEVPDLLVVSDMEFDEAIEDERRFGMFRNAARAEEAAADAGGGGWNGTHSRIAATFHALGMELHGKPMSAPNIIFWNVRCSSVAFPCASDQPGVIFLSGYSASLCKYVLSGEMETQTAVGIDEDGVVITETVKATPLSMLNTVLHDAGLHVVREALAPFV